MKKLFGQWKKTILIGAVIFIVAFALRLYNLTIIPIFGDEAIYIRWSQVMRADSSLRFLPLSDGKQPLFMWSVIPLLKVFSDPLFAGRAVSVVSGVLTFLGVFVLTYILFRSKKASLIAAGIYALSPFSVFFDRLALADSMLTTFGVWTLVFAVLTVRTMRLDFAMLAGFALGGALLTKSPSIFFAILLPTAWILSEFPKTMSSLLRHMAKLVILTLVTLLIGYAMYNILRLGTNFHMIDIRNQDYVYGLRHLLEAPLNPFVSHIKQIFAYFLILGPYSLIALFALGVYSGFKKNLRATLILLLWALVPIAAAAEYSKTMTARYVYSSLPFLVAISSASFVGAKNNLKNIAYVVLIFFLLHSFVFDFKLLKDPSSAPLPRSERSGYLEEWTSGTGISEVSKFLRQEYLANPSQKIVVGTEGYFGTLPDGLQVYLNDLPEIIVIGAGQPIWNPPRSLIESKMAGNKTYLVVNSTRYFGNPEKEGLILVAVYPKAVKPDGGRETLLFFELSDASIPKKSSN